MIRILDSATGTLLHVVVRLSDVADGHERSEIIEPDNFLQAAIIKPLAGREFAPHFHLERQRKFNSLIAQEAWVVISGSVKVTYFDLNHQIVGSEVLEPGDCSITLYGGHSYSILSEGTTVYEFKSGPYEGQSVDKKFIELA